MNVEQILEIPADEVAFIYPSDARADRFDPRFTALRVPRRGLLEWSSFEKDPPYLQKFMKLPTDCAVGWKPSVVPLTRFVASETNMVDHLKSTIINRVNSALHTISPGISIIGTCKHFDSYGTDDNRVEGAREVHIGPDLPVLDCDLINPPDILDLEMHMLTFGDAKVKHLTRTGDPAKILPGTIGCYESWLAQAVQCCIDLDISIGWVLTNLELVMFHLSRFDDNASRNSPVTTRSTKNVSSMLEALQSDTTQEPDFSSPLLRKTHDWIKFTDGDKDIPFVSGSNINKQQSATPAQSSYSAFSSPATPLRLTTLPSSPLGAKRPRDDSSPETPRSSRHQHRNSRLAPQSTDRRTTPEPFGLQEFPLSSSQIGTVSPSEYNADLRSEDVSHVLILSCALTDRDVARRLVELIILAKRAKDHNVLGIGPWKLSHSALDKLEVSSTS